MSTDYEVRKANSADVLNLLSNLRPEDARECHAQVGPNFVRVLRAVTENAPHTYSGFYKDRLLCVFGVMSRHTILSDEGIAWMLATNNLKDHAVPFARYSVPVVQNMLSEYRELFNFVDARNYLAVRWLKWLGFTVFDAVPYGLNGEPFHPFNMKRKG